MNYSKETHDLIERMCKNVERKSFRLYKKKSEELILRTYDLFELERPKNIVWCNDIFGEFNDKAWSAGSARSAKSAWSAELAGSARSAWLAGSALSAESARSAMSAGSAKSAGSARSAMSAGSALDYDFDWFIIEHEYIKNRKNNPGNEPNNHDFKYLEYSELLLQAKEAGLGYRVEHNDTLYLVPTPLVLIDEENRFHSETKPAIRWKKGEELFYLKGVKFEKEWWTKIVNDELTPEEILAIDNIEHRRIAWEYMDKKKLEGLKDFKVLDEVKDDGKGNPMRIVSFKHPDVDDPVKYYNCFCPTTGREYYLGTEEETCQKAKAKSFGLEDVEFANEW